MGMLYKRGRTWWIKYYRAGEMFRESSGSTKRKDATDLLKVREGRIASGAFTGLKPEKTTFEELAEDFLNDYRVNQRAASDTVEVYIERLRKHFGGMKAVAITSDKVMAFIAERKLEETRIGTTPSNATLNRELAALRRMLNLGRKNGKVVTVPFIAALAENNVRKGFFNHADYLKLKASVPDHVRPILTLAYFTGMRLGEILKLRWSQVDFNDGTIHLSPGETKNDEARVLPMAQDLRTELESQKKLRDERFATCEHVFFNHSTGERVRSFRTAWKNACKKLGLKESKFHDFRRTAVRNLVRAGTPEKVCMAVSGHKTRSVFERYNIVSTDDVKAAVRAVETYLSNLTGTIRAQSANFEAGSGQSLSVT